MLPDDNSTATASLQDVAGWQRQAESSELGDGGLLVRETIAKAFGLDAASRLTLPLCASSGLYAGPDENSGLSFSSPTGTVQSEKRFEVDPIWELRHAFQRHA